MFFKRLMISGGLLCVMAGIPAQAQYKELDGIVAVVDDDVVLASELHSRIETVRQQFAGAGQQLLCQAFLQFTECRELLLQQTDFPVDRPEHGSDTLLLLP